MDKTTLHAEFANWLATKMAARKLNQSDLARCLYGSRKDTRGYNVARNRDRIGHYLSGTSYPILDTVYKLADVFEVFPDDIPGPGRPLFTPRTATERKDTFMQINKKLDRILELLDAKR